MNPLTSLQSLRALGISLALLAPMSTALAQQGPRFGLAPAEAPKPAAVPALARPLVIIRSQPVYLQSYSGNFPSSSGNSLSSSRNSYSAPQSSPPAQSPYLVGPGQWVPEGTQVEMLALQSAPGFTRATPASASAHWDWQRTAPGDLVEMSRRNKASRTTN